MREALWHLLLFTGNPDFKIDAYISLSGPGQRFFDIMLQQAESMAKGGMASFVEERWPFELYKRSIEMVRAGIPIPEDMMRKLPPFGVHTMDEGSKQ